MVYQTDLSIFNQKDIIASNYLSGHPKVFVAVSLNLLVPNRSGMRENSPIHNHQKYSSNPQQPIHSLLSTSKLKAIVFPGDFLQDLESLENDLSGSAPLSTASRDLDLVLCGSKVRNGWYGNHGNMLVFTILNQA